MRKSNLLILGMGAIILGGCASTSPALSGVLDARFGKATSENIAAHAVTPPKAQKQNTYIPADARRAQKTRENYRENALPEPASVNP